MIDLNLTSIFSLLKALLFSCLLIYFILDGKFLMNDNKWVREMYHVFQKEVQLLLCQSSLEFHIIVISLTESLHVSFMFYSWSYNSFLNVSSFNYVTFNYELNGGWKKSE